MNFDFEYPLFFLLLVALPFFWWAMVARRRSRPGLYFPAAERAGVASEKSGRGRSIHFLAFLRTLALALLIAALAGPRFGSAVRESSSEGIDIMMAVDISGSMLALDLDWKGSRATRLEVVKDVVGDFVAKRPGDRIGLIAFGSEPYLVSPLTLEHKWLKANLDRIEVGVVDSGTSIGPPVGLAIRHLQADREAKSRVVILLTDGNDSVQAAVAPEKYAEAAAALGIRLYTVGVGRGGVVPTYYLDPQGNLVRSPLTGQPDVTKMDFPLDETTLRAMADKANGRYFRARDLKDLREVYAEIDRLEKTKVKLTYRTEYEDKWVWPLLAGLLVLLLEQVLAWTKFRPLP